MSRLIHSLEVPGITGRMGLCPCPGRERPLSVDVESLSEWGTHGVVSLMEDHEFAMLGVQSLPERIEALGMRCDIAVTLRAIYPTSNGVRKRGHSLRDPGVIGIVARAGLGDRLRISN